MTELERITAESDARTAILARRDIALLEEILQEAKDEQLSTHLVVELKLVELRRQAGGDV